MRNVVISGTVMVALIYRYLLHIYIYNISWFNMKRLIFKKSEWRLVATTRIFGEANILYGNETTDREPE